MQRETGRHLIEARALRKDYGVIPVLHDVDLDMAHGSTVAVLGANGAGKTTLLRLLACISRASGGTLKLFGLDCHPGRAPLDVLARIGFVGHEPLVYQDLTPRQNLEFFARLYPRATSGAAASEGERARLALSRVGLEHVMERPTRALSRGMLQRLALARATLHAPDLLLLDEPFTSLDDAGSQWLGGLLREAHALGGSTVLVTHDLRWACELSDRILVLKDGRIALDLAPVPSQDDLIRAYRTTTGLEPDNVDHRP